ncbi:MAG: SDR family NAD(P)-dependent oxidoreductase [Pseudomonadota bacterium]
MTKTILLTGATDGIGFEAAKLLAAQGHTLLIHGRSTEKLARTEKTLSEIDGVGKIQSYRADLSELADVQAMATSVAADHQQIDVLINNAGIFKTAQPIAANGIDVRFVVNTLAPYLLTRQLLERIPADGRIVNLSSAAQATVDYTALNGDALLADNAAYAQSKLAITMWSAALAEELGADGPVVVAVNPASFLGSKMVKEAYGVPGNDISIGADILVRAALSDEFADATGRYYDNDNARFAPPHADAQNADNNRQLMGAVESLLNKLSAAA